MDKEMKEVHRMLKWLVMERIERGSNWRLPHVIGYGEEPKSSLPDVSDIIKNKEEK